VEAHSFQRITAIKTTQFESVANLIVILLSKDQNSQSIHFQFQVHWVATQEGLIHSKYLSVLDPDSNTLLTEDQYSQAIHFNDLLVLHRSKQPHSLRKDQYSQPVHFNDLLIVDSDSNALLTEDQYLLPIHSKYSLVLDSDSNTLLIED
jgi:hypothetical protein